MLESLLIHHPTATLIVLSPTLNDTEVFLPFRKRGYRVYAFNISIDHILEWHWYLDSQSKDFLRHWNTSSPHFQSHIADYIRTVVLYLYGGTYIAMDMLILQPLPYQEFLGYDQSCLRCANNTSELCVATSLMRFRSYHRVLRDILRDTYDRRVYNESCLDCLGTRPFTEHVLRHQQANPSSSMNLRIFEPHRFYPFVRSNISLVFHDVRRDTPLQLADLMKRSYSLHLFGKVSDRINIARGSLIDLLFDRYDLGDLRSGTPHRDSTNPEVALIRPSVYTYTRRKQGRFLGHDVIYLKLNEQLGRESVRWNVTVRVSNGTIHLSSHRSLTGLNQAHVNMLLSEMLYEPFRRTSIDRLTIELKSDTETVRDSVTILIFSRWVSVLTKTMGTPDRWPVLQRLTASVEKFFPGTKVHIASDSGHEIDKSLLLNFTLFDSSNGHRLMRSVLIYNMPEDSGLSACRNYLVNHISTPFFFLLDDDFAIEDDSHLDHLLELIYTHDQIDIIAGKIPEDVRTFHDYSGFFLLYNETLELVHEVPDDTKDEAVFRPSTDEDENLDTINVCRRVDFVPNAFMGRTTTIRSVGWDEQLKLGEHEDFFLRLGRANRIVFTCEHIQVHHYQQPWWVQIKSPYYQRRARVYQYYKNMLVKNHLKRIITFDQTNLDLDEMPKSESVLN